ncbi:MAG: hypothetical protein U7126_07625 [Microcoleus sp.]
MVVTDDAPIDRTLIRNKIAPDSIKCRRSRSPQKLQMGDRICTRKISSKNNVLEIRQKADNALYIVSGFTGMI